MMTTNLFFIANVKQLRTGDGFRILLPSFRTSWGVWVLNEAIINSFHNRVGFGTILEGLRNFGGFESPLGAPQHCTTSSPVRLQHDIRVLCTVTNFQRFPTSSGAFPPPVCRPPALRMKPM